MLSRVQAVVLAFAAVAGVQAQSKCPITVTDFYSTSTFLYPCCTTTTTIDAVTTYTPTTWVTVYPTTTAIAGRALKARESPCTIPPVTTSVVAQTAAPNPSSTWTVTAYSSTVTATPPVTKTTTVSSF
ncbi:hypothetical protein DL93DRAFT_2081921 [Clavulina sp. PMI_390]|nr:hypothetical protein DL93DRAFT_2081921 [Clavulina sp. PMI_390]